MTTKTSELTSPGTLPKLTVTADAYVRRVTLNLLRHATCCPEDVRLIVDRLADDLGWDWDKLNRLEHETIFGKVGDPLLAQARDEFDVDLSTIIDHAWNRGTGLEGHVGEDGIPFCQLCGHKHVRWEFLARNITRGDNRHERTADVWRGSTCIEVYGIRVDGEATAEAALEKLRGAISAAKVKVERRGWQEANPAHREDMRFLRRADWRLATPIPWRERELWPNRFGYRVSDKVFRREVKATLKYYDKNGFLTEGRTEALDGLREYAKVVLVHEAEVRAICLRDPRKVWWIEFADRHPRMTPYQTKAIDEARAGQYDPTTLGHWMRSMVAEIEKQHRDAVPPPPPLPPRAQKAAAPTPVTI